MLSSAGVTSRLDRLERRGFVRRLPDPDDRRGVIVDLTDSGLEIVDAAVVANTASDRQLMERFDPQELEMLEVLLRKLLAGLDPPRNRLFDKQAPFGLSVGSRPRRARLDHLGGGRPSRRSSHRRQAGKSTGRPAFRSTSARSSPPTTSGR